MIPEITNFYRKYRKRLYNTAYRVLWDEMEAEDVVQEVVIRFLKDSNRIDNERQREAWLVKACIRLSIDCLRKRTSMRLFYQEYRQEQEGNPSSGSFPDDSESVWNSLIEENEKKKLIALIHRELSTLPEGYRTVLSLVLLEGLTYTETAEFLGISESGIRSQYMRGKRLLAEKVGAKLKRQSN